MDNYLYGSGQQGHYPWTEGNSNNMPQNNPQYFPPPPTGPPPTTSTSISGLAKTFNIFSGKPSYAPVAQPVPYPATSTTYTTTSTPYPTTYTNPQYTASPDSYATGGQTFTPYPQHNTRTTSYPSYPSSQTCTPGPQNYSGNSYYQPNTTTPNHGHTSTSIPLNPAERVAIEPLPSPYPQHANNYSNSISSPPPHYAPQTPVPQLRAPAHEHVSDPPKDSPAPSSPFRPPSTVAPTPTNCNSNSQDADRERAQLWQTVADLQTRLASTETELQNSQSEITRLQGELSLKANELTSKSTQLNGALNEGHKAQGEIARLQAELSQKTNELTARSMQLNSALNEIREAHAKLAQKENEENMQVRELTAQFRELEVQNQEIKRGMDLSQLWKSSGFDVVDRDGPYGVDLDGVLALQQELSDVKYKLQQRDEEIAYLKIQNSNNFSSSPAQITPSYAGGQTTMPTAQQAFGGNTSTGQVPNELQLQAHGLFDGQAWGEDQGPFPSKALEEWHRQKNQEHTGGVIILDTCMEKLIGAENFKLHLLKTKAKIDTILRQGVNLGEEVFDLLITGNPGTSKSLLSL